MRSFAAVVLVVVGLSVASCGGIDSPSTNQDTPFTGTIAVGGADTQAFSASKSGELIIKITSLTPTVQNAVVGLTWAQAGSDSTCKSNFGGVVQQTVLQVGLATNFGQIVKGSYCLILRDVGAFTVPETYNMTVSHP
jgi:hypothetical protein